MIKIQTMSGPPSPASSPPDNYNIPPPVAPNGKPVIPSSYQNQVPSGLTLNFGSAQSVYQQPASMPSPGYQQSQLFVPQQQGQGAQSQLTQGNQAQFTQGNQEQFTQGHNLQAQMTLAGNNILRIEPYTQYSFIVRGDTKTYKDSLKTLGKATYVSKPKQGSSTEPGWVFSYKDNALQGVINYVSQVNRGEIGPPPPSAPTQRISYEVFRPEEGMQVNINMPNGVGRYTVGSVSRTGYIVNSAVLFMPTDQNNHFLMVLVKGPDDQELQWQIKGYRDKHTITPVI